MSGDTTGTIVPDSQGMWRHSTIILMLGTSQEILKVVRMVAEVETEIEAKTEAMVEQLEPEDKEEVMFLVSRL